MPKLLVLFHSRTGHTARLADAIAEGARAVRFTEVDVRRIADLAPDSDVSREPGRAEARERLAARYRSLDDVAALAGYDGIVLGSPSHDGTVSAELGSVIAQAGALRAQGAFVDTVGSAFAPVQTSHADQEATLWGIMAPMAKLGMILVPPGYTDAASIDAGGEVAEADLAAARHQGKRVAEVTEWVRHARSHAAGHAHGGGGHHHH